MAALLPAAPARAAGDAVDSSTVNLPKALDDSLTTLLAEAQATCLREGDPSAPQRDHPTAWAKEQVVLERLLTFASDSILKGFAAQNYFTDRGARLRYPYYAPHLYPRLVGFENTQRPEEAGSFLLEPVGGGWRFQRLAGEDTCCWHATKMRPWKEAGGEYLLVLFQRFSPQAVQFMVQRLARTPQGWQVLSSDGGNRFGPRYSLDMIASEGAAPWVEAMEMEKSDLFTHPPAETWIKWLRVYESHADSLHRVRELLGDSYFGPPTWVMEAMARQRPQLAAPYVTDEQVLEKFSRLPWGRARTGWKFESWSAHHDTLTCSHPAVGRLTIYCAADQGKLKVSDYRLEPAGAPPAKPEPTR